MNIKKKTIIVETETRDLPGNVLMVNFLGFATLPIELSYWRGWRDLIKIEFQCDDVKL